jgi:hypothetical protein
MTVKSDLEKAKASAQGAMGNYATFSSSTEDPMAKQMFEQMQQDMQRHVDMINNRLNYVNQNNNLNSGQAPTQGAQNSSVNNLSADAAKNASKIAKSAENKTDKLLNTVKNNQTK